MLPQPPAPTVVGTATVTPLICTLHESATVPALISKSTMSGPARFTIGSEKVIVIASAAIPGLMMPVSRYQSPVSVPRLPVGGGSVPPRSSTTPALAPANAVTFPGTIRFRP